MTVRRTLRALTCGAALLAAAFVGKHLRAQPPVPPGPAVQPAAPQNVAPNPLGRLLRRVFAPDGAERPANSAAPDAPVEAVPADRIDRRAPHDPQSAKQLRQAESLLAGGNAKEAVLVLQWLLDQPDGSLVRDPQGRWSPIPARANRLLGTLSPEDRDRYRLEYEGVARQAWETARNADDAAGLALVARRYLHTDAGRRAATQLAASAMDRGEFQEAVRRYRELLDLLGPHVSQETAAAWRIRGALAAARGGDRAAAAELARGHETAKIVLPSGAGGAARETTLEDAVAALAGRTRATVRTPAPVEWSDPFGNARHHALGAPGTPLLVSRWTHPTAYGSSLRTQAEELRQELDDQRKVLVPAFLPLLVDGRLAVRTLHGVQVIDADSGRPLWETNDPSSPERLLEGMETHRRRLGMTPWDMRAQGFGPRLGEQHPLVGPLFLDGPSGTISSDGERLFVIEDHVTIAPGQGGFFLPNGQTPDMDDSPYATNRLVAYDLRTGRPAWLWHLGGRKMGEDFDSPLAGTYFFGAPVADQDDLFAVGESQNEVRLHVLDRRTGLPRWSHRLAYSDAKIGQDLQRRPWAAPVAVAEGVVVCPTTQGWVIGVSRRDRSLLWAARLDPPGPQDAAEFNGGAPGIVQPMPLGQRWCNGAPIVSGGRVVVAAPESQHVACVELHTGRLLWRLPRGDGAYVAGVFDEVVVVVGAATVTGSRLTDGQTIWTRPLAPPDGRPAGRGVAVRSHAPRGAGQPVSARRVEAAADADGSPDAGRILFHLPLSSGRLLTLDTADGTVADTAFLPAGASVLGNLVMYRGMLFSAGPTEIASFEERAGFENRLAEIRRQDPHDPRTLLTEARMHRVHRADAEAAAALRKLPPESVPAELRSEWRALRIESLAGLVRAEPKARDAEFAELESVVDRSDARESFALVRLRAERLETRGAFAEAFATLLEPVDRLPDDSVKIDSAPPVLVKPDRWLGSRLGDLWERLSPNERGTIGARLAARWQTLDAPAGVPDVPPDRPIDGNAARAADAAAAAQAAAESRSARLAELDRFARVFAFHPSAVEATFRLAQLEEADGRFAEAELRLRRLIGGSDEDVAARAAVRCVELLHRAGLPRDALAAGRALLPRLGERPVGEGRTFAQFLTAFQESIGAATRLEPVSADWSSRPVQAQRAGMNGSGFALLEVDVHAPDVPFFREHRFDVDQQFHRLEVFRGRDESPHWIAALRAAHQHAADGVLDAETHGHVVVLESRSTLFVLSPVDRRMLWSRPLDAGDGVQRGIVRRNVPPLMPATSLPGAQGVFAGRGRAGNVHPEVTTTAQYVVIPDRRGVVVADLATGAERWRLTDLPFGTQIVGNEQYVVVRPPDGTGARAFRAEDGRPAAIPGLDALLARTIRLLPRHFVVFDAGGALLGPAKDHVLRAVDPLRPETAAWSVSVPRNARAARLDSDLVAVLPTDGGLFSVDLQTGAVRRTAGVPADMAKDLSSGQATFVLHDGEHLLLGINRPARSGFYYSENVPYVQLNGPLLAFDAEDGRLAWKIDVPQQNLILQRIDRSPLLVFAVRQLVRKPGTTFWTLRLAAYDKRTGEKRFDAAVPSTSGFQSLHVDQAERFVELRSYSDRVRLVAGDEPGSK